MKNEPLDSPPNALLPTPSALGNCPLAERTLLL